MAQRVTTVMVNYLAERLSDRLGASGSYRFVHKVMPQRNGQTERLREHSGLVTPDERPPVDTPRKDRIGAEFLSGVNCQRLERRYVNGPGGVAQLIITESD
jgi:hypothetical protein